MRNHLISGRKGGFKRCSLNSANWHSISIKGAVVDGIISAFLLYHQSPLRSPLHCIMIALPTFPIERLEPRVSPHLLHPQRSQPLASFHPEVEFHMNSANVAKILINVGWKVNIWTNTIMDKGNISPTKVENQIFCNIWDIIGELGAIHPLERNQWSNLICVVQK